MPLQTNGIVVQQNKTNRGIDSIASQKGNKKTNSTAAAAAAATATADSASRSSHGGNPARTDGSQAVGVDKKQRNGYASNSPAGDCFAGKPFDISPDWLHDDGVIKCACCCSEDGDSHYQPSPTFVASVKPATPSGGVPPPPTPSILHPLPRREQELRDEALGRVGSVRGGAAASRQESFRSFRSDVDETDLDQLSQYSLFMEKDVRYYFQHPYLRLTVAYLVTFCNFLIYAEDPIAHSEKECSIPVIGNMFAFVCSRYPANAWSVLKVFMWLLAIVCGLLFGKQVVHKLLFNKLLRLRMFVDEQGSWMVMFFTCVFFLFTFSFLYNALLLIGGASTASYHIDSVLGITNSTFMKAAACGTWLGDLFTAWMVTDIMLQERLYPHWAKHVRKWWRVGNKRIYLFWFLVIALTVVVVTVIVTDVISWDRMNHDFMPTNEVSRAFLASFILVMDLFIVMQDWDFPHFVNNFDLKLPGINSAHLQFRICKPRFLNQEYWTVHISGKWFNYGIIFMVMLLDLNMWKNQIFYEPNEYGQYVNNYRKIHTVRNSRQLREHNATMLTYDWRSTNVNNATGDVYLAEDMVMNTKYSGYSLPIKGIAFIPSLLAFVVFGVLVYWYGRFKPNRKNVYAGRLKKRRKRADAGATVAPKSKNVDSSPSWQTVAAVPDSIVVSNDGGGKIRNSFKTTRI
ncbi:transmembrane protein 117-like [Tubulanus polymorphus]|uniref:transmembrane protein 117-like n=1 Tax=Tubulanus polymorphus TaxID=672921 RepID=UPI003DA49839